MARLTGAFFVLLSAIVASSVQAAAIPPVFHQPQIIAKPVFHQPQVIAKPVFHQPQIFAKPVFQKPQIFAKPVFQKPQIFAKPVVHQPQFQVIKHAQPQVFVNPLCKQFGGQVINKVQVANLLLNDLRQFERGVQFDQFYLVAHGALQQAHGGIVQLNQLFLGGQHDLRQIQGLHQLAAVNFGHINQALLQFQPHIRNPFAIQKFGQLRGGLQEAILFEQQLINSCLIQPQANQILRQQVFPPKLIKQIAPPKFAVPQVIKGKQPVHLPGQVFDLSPTVTAPPAEFTGVDIFATNTFDAEVPEITDEAEILEEEQLDQQLEEEQLEAEQLEAEQLEEEQLEASVTESADVALETGAVEGEGEVAAAEEEAVVEGEGEAVVEGEEAVVEGEEAVVEGEEVAEASASVEAEAAQATA